MVIMKLDHMESVNKMARPELLIKDLEGFAEIAQLITSSRERVIESVNTGDNRSVLEDRRADQSEDCGRGMGRRRC